MQRHILGALVGAILVPAMAWSNPACRSDTVQLRGDWGKAQFRVEVADDADERAQGLMHRETMSPGAGMLFVFERTGSVSFWMKNTLIPLDMLFMNEQGVVTHIHENAVPHDITPILGGSSVRYVLEINGGLSQAIGITSGSQVRHPSILQSGAVWPCEDGS